jgi:hypothetical protein
MERTEAAAGTVRTVEAAGGAAGRPRSSWRGFIRELLL